jgi:hypothetical protein
MGAAASAGGAGRPTGVAGRWGPLAIVVGLIALVVGGGQVVSDAVSVGGGSTLTVGGLLITPRPGWDVESVTASPPTAVLHRGPVVLAVAQLPPEPAGPLTVAARYLDERVRPMLSQLATGQPQAVTLPNGVPGVRVTYVGVTPEGLAIEGVVTAATGSRSSAIFDASAPSGELVAVADDVRAMVDHAVVP